MSQFHLIPVHVPYFCICGNVVMLQCYYQTGKLQTELGGWNVWFEKDEGMLAYLPGYTRRHVCFWWPNQIISQMHKPMQIFWMSQDYNIFPWKLVEMIVKGTGSFYLCNAGLLMTQGVTVYYPCFVWLFCLSGILGAVSSCVYHLSHIHPH